MLRLLVRQATRHASRSSLFCQIARSKHSLASTAVPISKDLAEIKTSNTLAVDPVKLPSTNHLVFKIGDYVEAVRGNQYSGLVVGVRQASGKLQRVTLLLRNGKKLTFMSDSILFCAPSFDRSIRLPPGVSQLSLLSQDVDGVLEEIPQEYTRVVADYQIRLRLGRAQAHMKLLSLPAAFEGKSSVSLDSLSEFVFQSKEANYRHIVFNHLLSENIKFVPASSTMGSEDWILRSPKEIKRISTVIAAIRGRTPDYIQFLSKVRIMLQFYQSHADPLLGTIPSQAVDVFSRSAPILTDMDRDFLNFVTDWVRSPNSIDTSPYEVFVPNLLKALKVYDNLFFDKTLATRFLTEMGMFKPWDNVQMLSKGHVAEEFFWTDRAKEADSKMAQYANAFLSGEQPDPADICGSIRHDFGDLPVYTIDDPSAKEIDDGVSIEQIPGEDATWLHVHVADPTTYIHPEHELAPLIQRRVETLYLTERHFPMLPESLSSKKFSLGDTAQKNANGQQNAMTFSTKVSREGELLDYTVRPSLVKNVRKVYYDDVDRLLSPIARIDSEPLIDTRRSFSHPSDVLFSKNTYKDTLQPTFEKDLLALYELSQRHLTARVRQGAIAFARPSPTISILQELDLPAIQYNVPEYASSLPPLRLSLSNFHRSPSRQMVAETMIMGGRVASLFARDQGINILYRSQVWPADASPGDLALRQKLSEACDPNTGFLGYREALPFMRIFPPATLSTTPGLPHATMGIQDGYSKVTSPLRRYTDVLAHWQIKAHLLKEKAFFTRQQLDAMIPTLETRAKRLKALQKQNTDFWVVHLIHRLSADALSLRNRTWDCTINTVNENALTQLGGNMVVAFGTLLDFGIRARIENVPRQLDLGETVKVRISKIDQTDGRISLQLAE
ncbi:hypothetical protein BY458DRAFT_587756 [Sporodiniella umbellata]|nr:hypothetical protein BY458DRAFT_587756 [Sporodiniella umbellata]